jgi:4-amino-4-deoxychorismate lyase
MPFNLITNLDSSTQANLLDRGLHYGDGLFETMLIVNGSIRYWREHYLRLSSSASKINIKCPEESWFKEKLRPFLDFSDSHIIKIVITRGSGGRGVFIPNQLSPNVYILKYDNSNIVLNQSITTIISEITLPKNKNLAGLKHLNRLDYVLAADDLKQQPDYDEALMSDVDGFIIEGIVHNLFFARGNEIYTPQLSTSGVDGIMRQLILKKLNQGKKKVNIGTYTKQDVLNADECFMCNSVRGIRAVLRVQQQEYNIGPVTRQLQQEFHDL